MDSVIGLAVSAAGKVGHGLTQPYSHVRDIVASSKGLDGNHDCLRRDLDTLVFIKDRNDVEIRRCKQFVILNSYSVWVTNVSETVAEVEKLMLEYRSKRRGLRRWHLQRRSRLSEEMEKKFIEVRKLTENGKLQTRFRVERVLKVSNVVQIKGFPTLQSSLENILDSLNERETRLVGVCGMMGVGKTTILLNLNNNQKIANLFDIVILVRVSAVQSSYCLQQAIANRLMLDVGGIHDHNMVANTDI
ncbi:Disease resistance protein [Quillaja saponaria]|uniref:Disease resistance protein n=1 Tax=Quillaja saponaria TaxID=32244 RepID=A0AAD7M1I0_QUISA|nr:Disease resistance protein [Quillaja saponaria]